jgi:hypothetical protein
MSVANFGPTLRVSSVVNAQVAAIGAPVVGDGAAVVYTDIIRTLGGVELPLVLAAGVYSVRSVASINIANAANTIIYGQCELINTVTGAVLGAGQLIAGCAYANGNSVSFTFDFGTLLNLAATTSIALRYATSGNSAIQNFNAGASMTAFSLN